jgi:hypothetical protein
MVASAALRQYDVCRILALMTGFRAVDLRRAFAVLVLVLLAVAAAAAARAQAQPGLLVGVDEDQFKWVRNGEPLQAAVADLGLGAVRITQRWTPGQTRISAVDLGGLLHAVAPFKGTGVRVVLSVFGGAADAPQDAAARAQYCGYVRSILVAVPDIGDVAIWNEVNSPMFWRPQFGGGAAVAPASYEALLEACYGTLHTARPGLNVITSLAPRGNDDPRFDQAVRGSPARFALGVGAAYRAGGRQVKIFDTWGQNVYGLNSAERPWRSHPKSGNLSQGDYPALIDALWQAFSGTRQPLPGEGGVTVWFLEDGFQTAVDPAHAALYHGRENAGKTLAPASRTVDPAHPADDSPAPDQGTQLADALRLAYCQPGVGAFFNFMLADESDLGGWQSGVLWADWSRKPAYAAFHDAIQQVRSGTISCGALKGGSAGGTQATLVATTRRPG